jgi:site-specific recombinase XerD
MKRVDLFSAFVRRRLAASHLGIILEDFARDLEKAGYLRSTIQDYLRVAEHFSFWLARRHVSVRQITAELTNRFVRQHLSRCSCPKPASSTPRNCLSALHRLWEFLQRRGVVVQRSEPSTPIDRLVATYEHYMSQTCGLAHATQVHRRRYCREFLRWRFGKKPLRPERIQRSDILLFVGSRSKGLRPASIKVMTVSLRSFLRFLQLQGRVKPAVVAAVPSLPAWERFKVPQTLNQKQMADLLRTDLKMIGV